MATKELCYVTVNRTAPAHLIKGITVNGRAYHAWDICGSEVFISQTRSTAIEKMEKALKNNVTF